MNTRFGASVVCLMGLVSGIGATGCVGINGGAVELAWSVRTVDALPADCEMQNIATISLCIQSCDEDAGTGETCTGATMCPFDTFACTRLRGATDFDVAPGKKRLWITVACGDGSPADVVVPEAVLRDVTRGDVTELNALLISVPSDKLACGS